MKILSNSQIKAADNYTIKNEPIKSVDLMERAAGKCFDWIYENAPRLFPVSITEESAWVFHVVCGMGNNGGDGLVIARLLQRNGYNVEISLVRFTEEGSDDFNVNFGKLGAAKKSVRDIRSKTDIPAFAPDCVVIDAIFGSGISRVVDGVAAETIQAINTSGATVVSIDMPSGIFSADNSGNDLSKVVCAHHVLTFETPKLSFFLAECAPLVGKIHVLDIGLHPDFMRDVEVVHNVVTPDMVAAFHKPRQRFSHKGTFGHALIIAGSPGKWGAAVLAVKACMRAGAGLVSVHIGKAGGQMVGNHLPEAMVLADESDTHFSNLPDLSPFSAIGVGPGIGTSSEVAATLKLLIQESKVPLVLDADALNILSENKTWLAFLPKGSILTPHPGEFARLAGEKLSHFAAIEKQRELSQKHQIYILLKGAHSSLSLPDGQVLINSTGNPGMASAGMGDTLTGIITGFLAGPCTSMEAAALGMYIHGKAGDLALKSQSHESLIASDLIDHLGLAFKSLHQI